MKVIISERQYSLLFEQSDFMVDKRSNALLNAAGIRSDKDYKEVSKITTQASKSLSGDPHTLLAIVGIATAFIPVAGPFISAGVGLLDASLYYKEGDKTSAAISGALSLLPLIGKIPGVKETSSAVWKSIASKLRVGEKLTQAELELVKEVGSNASSVQTLVSDASKKISPLVKQIQELKPEYISRYGQDGYEKIMRDFMSGAIDQNEFLNVLKGGQSAAPGMANFATKLGIKFSKEELQTIENLAINIRKGTPYQTTLVNTKNGLKKISIFLTDSATIAKKSPASVDRLGYVVGDDLIVINSDKLGSSILDVKELIGHEMAHIKDPSMVSSKLSSTYVKKGEKATLSNYFLHQWEVNAVTSASLQNMTNTTKNWMRYLPKEQLSGYLDEIVKYAKGTQKFVSKPVIDMIGEDGIDQMRLLYTQNKKGYTDFLSKLAQQASYLKSQLNVAM